MPIIQEDTITSLHQQDTYWVIIKLSITFIYVTSKNIKEAILLMNSEYCLGVDTIALSPAIRASQYSMATNEKKEEVGHLTLP